MKDFSFTDPLTWLIHVTLVVDYVLLRHEGIWWSFYSQGSLFALYAPLGSPTRQDLTEATHSSIHPPICSPALAFSQPLWVTLLTNPRSTWWSQCMRQVLKLPGCFGDSFLVLKTPWAEGRTPIYYVSLTVGDPYQALLSPIETSFTRVEERGRNLPRSHLGW